MADVGPIDVLQETNAEVAYPIIRDMDTFCYERQSAGSMEVGSYAHRAIFHHPDDIPSNEESPLSPTELPLTYDDFDPQMEQAIDLMEMLGDAEIKYAINGLLSLTPDAMPVLGETPEVRNLWSAAAVWVKEGRASPSSSPSGWSTATHACDPHGSDIARFYEHEKTEHHIYARCDEHYNKTYGIVHRWSNGRSEARAPQPVLRARKRSAPCSTTPAGGAPAVVRVERRPDGALSRQVRSASTSGTPAGGRRSSTPSTCTCASTSAWSTSRRSTSSTSKAPDAGVPRPHDGQLVQRAGRASVYTPLLTGDGGFRLTSRSWLGENHFRVVTGAFDGGRDKYWFTRNMPTDGAPVRSPIARRASARSASGGSRRRRRWPRSPPASTSRTTSRRPASRTGRCATC